jgi:hypothetical protein
MQQSRSQHSRRCSMQRAMVFLLFGPASVAFITCLALQETHAPFASFVAILSFFCILPISVLAGILDGYLATFIPIFLRAPLTGVVGAILVGGLALCFAASVSPPALTFWASVAQPTRSSAHCWPVTGLTSVTRDDRGRGTDGWSLAPLCPRNGSFTLRHPFRIPQGSLR